MVCVASLRVNCSESGGSPACKPSVDASPEIRVVLALGTATGGTPDFNGSHDTSGAINAAWPNACPISGLTSSALTATPLSVQVYEVDAFISTKLIDVCQFQLTPQNITSGGWSGACGNFVSNLSLQFR